MTADDPSHPQRPPGRSLRRGDDPHVDQVQDDIRAGRYTEDPTPYEPPAEGEAEARKRHLFDDADTQGFDLPLDDPSIRRPSPEADPYRWQRAADLAAGQGPPVIPGAGRGRHGGDAKKGPASPVREDPRRRSKLEVTRDVVWTAVGVMILLAMAAVLFLGIAALGERSREGATPTEAPQIVPSFELPCDEYPAFCTETPGD